MKKFPLKFIMIVIIILLFAYSLIVVLGQKRQPPNIPSNPADLIIPVPGGNVQVKNFTKNPVEAFGNNLALVENSNFIISYYYSDQSFLITILSQPVQTNRTAAEQTFLSKLQTDEANACKLKVSLTVPASVDQALAGQDYGLSFCPAGKSF